MITTVQLLEIIGVFLVLGYILVARSPKYKRRIGLKLQASADADEVRAALYQRRLDVLMNRAGNDVAHELQQVESIAAGF